jgi:peptidoglycan/LPS O-acetylase OafA/YrhL
MYAFLPIIYLLIRRFPSLWVISLIWFGSVAAAAVEYIARGNADSLLLRYFPCFLAGVLAWRLMETQRRRLPAALWVSVLITLIALYRLEDLFRVYGLNWQGILHGSLRNDGKIWLPQSADLVRDWLICGITGMLIPLFSEITSTWLNAITRRIAQYSYGIYLCHVPMLWVAFKLLHIENVFVCALLTICLTALTSFALYQLIEHPAIQFGKQFSTRLVDHSKYAETSLRHA